MNTKVSTPPPGTQPFGPRFFNFTQENEGTYEQSIFWLWDNKWRFEIIHPKWGKSCVAPEFVFMDGWMVVNFTILILNPKMRPHEPNFKNRLFLTFPML